ncbi:MAG: helix-turn-helix domain-containing protein [Oscillospiraceae bacterium]|nr:helix-turn-helix domain-containing protein [Oscillospiraceae bacterium]
MLSDNIKALRKSRGFTQEEVAVRLHVVRQTVSKWEKGLSVPDAEMLQRLAELFEVSVNQLLGAPPVQEESISDVAEQLARINEQLAVKNRRARRIWRVAAGVLIAFVVLNLLFILLAVVLGFVGTSTGSESMALGEPPILVVSFEEQQVTAALGTYSWEYQSGGAVLGTESDAAPLYEMDIPVLSVTEEDVTVSLLFEMTPDTVSVQCWDDSFWETDWDNVSDLLVVQTAATDGETMEARAGYVYQVTAVWKDAEGYSGTVNYSFCLELAE